MARFARAEPRTPIQGIADHLIPNAFRARDGRVLVLALDVVGEICKREVKADRFNHSYDGLLLKNLLPTTEKVWADGSGFPCAQFDQAMHFTGRLS